ncbi:hypothetical protein BJX76DRAFT_19566 [Aspergillus varians]
MGDQPPRQAFRSIAPKGTETEVPTTSRSPEDTRTKRASTACGECKQRRTKCTVDDSGGPCAECAFHNRECVIDELADKRRKVAAKETEENLKKSQKDLAIAQGELEYYRTYVRYLLDTIRFCQLTDVNKLVAVIRSGSTDEEIRAFLSQFANVFSQYSLQTPRGSDSTEGQDGTPGGRRHHGP